MEKENIARCPLCGETIQSGEHISIIDGIAYHKDCHEQEREFKKQEYEEAIYYRTEEVE